MIIISTTIFLIVGGIVFFSINYFAKGATYGFIQEAWTGGVTTNTAVHPTNETGWTEFSAKDANVATGTTVSITAETATLTHTTTDDFSNGTQQGILTSGDQLSLDLP